MEALFIALSPKRCWEFCALAILFLHTSASFGATMEFASREPVLKPEVLQFRNVVLGQSYMQQAVLTNSSRTPITIRDVRQSNSAFTLHPVSLPLKIKPGQNVGLEVDFTPWRSGKLSTTFTIATNRGPLVLHADGNGVRGGLVANTRSVNFGKLQVGFGKRLPVTLINSSPATQTISRILIYGSEFGMTEFNLPVRLAPNESVTFNATFAPHVKGTTAGRMVVESDGSGLAIPLSGQASQNGLSSVSPSQLTFGNVPVGASATLTATIRAASSTVAIYSAGITSSEFALSGLSFPLILAAGQSKSYQVTFSPKSTGSTSAALSFQTTIGSPTTETLSGAGITQTQQHHVTLTWNSSGAGVIGYNVYRATTSAGPFSKINSVPDSNTSYLDTSVQSGATYFYATTAIASGGTQSAFSNQVAVVIP